MLMKDPKKRIGTKSKEEIKNDPFFKNFDWQRMANKQYEAPEDFQTLEEDREVTFLYFFILFYTFFNSFNSFNSFNFH